MNSFRQLNCCLLVFASVSRLVVSLYHWGQVAPPLASKGIVLQGMVHLVFIIEKEGQRFQGVGDVRGG